MSAHDKSISRRSFAHLNSGKLPNSRPQMSDVSGKAQSAFDWNRDPHIQRQLEDKGKTEFERRQEQVNREKRRENFMIKRQQSKPQLRPAPKLAYGPDKAAFNQAWRSEQARADQAQQNIAKPQSREDRKAAFKAARSQTTETQTKARNQ